MFETYQNQRPYDNPITNQDRLVSGPRKYTNMKEYFRKRELTFYRRFPAAGPPPTTGFRSVWAFFFDDPGYQGESFTCHRLKGVWRP